MYTIHVCSSQSLIDNTFKSVDILPEKLSRIMVQRIIRIGLVKEKYQSVNDSINVHDWFPVFTKDIEAYISF